MERGDRKKTRLPVDCWCVSVCFCVPPFLLRQSGWLCWAFCSSAHNRARARWNVPLSQAKGCRLATATGKLPSCSAFSPLSPLKWSLSLSRSLSLPSLSLFLSLCLSIAVYIMHLRATLSRSPLFCYYTNILHPLLSLKHLGLSPG